MSMKFMERPKQSGKQHWRVELERPYVSDVVGILVGRLSKSVANYLERERTAIAW